MQYFRALIRNCALAALVACCLAGATGCSYSGAFSLPASPASPVTPTTATYVYAIDASSYNVYAFAANSNGTVAPVSTLVPPSGFTVSAVTTDPSGQIYLAGVDVNDNSTVLVYPKGSVNSATPTLTLLGGGNFIYPQAITTDSTGNLYVLDYGLSGGGDGGVSVSVYPLGANGAATPSRVLTDTTDATLEGLDIAADAAGNVFVSTDDINLGTGTILSYSASATGNVTPSNTITTPQFFYGIAVDGSDNIYAVEDNATTGADGAIVKFSSTATGAATPTNTISGSAPTIGTGGGLRLDSIGNIFIINEILTSQTTFTVDVLSFSSAATGNEAPMTSFNSSVLTNPEAAIALF